MISEIWAVLIAAGILAGGWVLVRKEHPPRWLGFLLIGAAVLRLAAGILWGATLPSWGHATPAEKAGYVMADAFERDQSAWKLAQSNKPLYTAFFNNRLSDQYGGLLFLSALVYRYLGGQTCHPQKKRVSGWQNMPGYLFHFQYIPLPPVTPVIYMPDGELVCCWTWLPGCLASTF